jgi:S1 RNA binding domain protein
MQVIVGEVVECKVTGTTKFGAFVDLGDGKSGMIHISEVAQTYVSEIGEFVKVGDTEKEKILSVSDDGKISLSIKKAQEPIKKERRQREVVPAAKPDMSYVWTKKSGPTDFEDMMNKFKQTSDEKFSDLKRKNPESKRSRRG